MGDLMHIFFYQLSMFPCEEKLTLKAVLPVRSNRVQLTFCLEQD